MLPYYFTKFCPEDIYPMNEDLLGSPSSPGQESATSEVPLAGNLFIPFDLGREEIVCQVNH